MKLDKIIHTLSNNVGSNSFLNNIWIIIYPHLSLVSIDDEQKELYENVGTYLYLVAASVLSLRRFTFRYLCTFSDENEKKTHCSLLLTILRQLMYTKIWYFNSLACNKSSFDCLFLFGKHSFIDPKRITWYPFVKYKNITVHFDSGVSAFMSFLESKSYGWTQ